MSAALEVRGLTAGYGAGPVLHDVSLQVPDGQVVTLLGANGAGKTTLLRAISGLLPTSGSVLLRGEDLTGVAPEQRVRRGLAHVPEGRGVITELTVEENLRLGGLWRHGRTALRARIDAEYERFEPLARRRRSLGHQLSGGERQMLALARALVSTPDVLLLDEPSLGLAPQIVHSIMQTLRDRCDETGLTVLLAEQNAASALSIADRGLVLHLGRIRTDAPADALARDAVLRHAYLGY
ncbi:ABC transporter ATP-binding protein [Kineosporia rhizophila]|uniref:ABC transporter ATP-binding protein n=1 Tax=Kineosporia TaxID=49184 RepID=UPI001E546022|nr:MULTISPECIES: ABC transporter ATP-binding protein [Kineosporia]MCE0536405.1 ABC transporter ATP-binding protein [Kineosporia rhizophila]GLY15503.1 ABC transporter ATP-binding protein [Kineosporia sp. NBRC 101677]